LTDQQVACLASVAARYLVREGVTFLKIEGLNGVIALGVLGGRFFVQHALAGELASGTVAEKGVEAFTRFHSLMAGVNYGRMCVFSATRSLRSTF
jgi:hypothetical protein